MVSTKNLTIGELSKMLSKKQMVIYVSERRRQIKQLVIEAFDSRLDALEKSNADLIAEATMPCPHCGVRFEGEKGK